MIDIADLKPWSGTSSGTFHLDFLGVKTDPEFWSGTKPAKPGRLSVSLPGLSEFYLEYAALVMAATYARNRPAFRVVEVGAAWGLWTVRAAALARRLGIPASSIAIEPLPAQIAQMKRHYITNGLNPACHQIEDGVLGDSSGKAWIRFSQDTDLSARVVNEDWVAGNAVAPLLGQPQGIELPCRDGSMVMSVRQRHFREIVPADMPVDFLHLRVGPGPDRVLDGPGFDASNIGVLVLPSLNATDDPRVEKRLNTLGFSELLHLPRGFVIKTPRGDVVLRGALRIYAGKLVPAAEIALMAEKLATIAGAKVPLAA